MWNTKIREKLPVSFSVMHVNSDAYVVSDCEGIALENDFYNLSHVHGPDSALTTKVCQSSFCYE